MLAAFLGQGCFVHKKPGEDKDKPNPEDASIPVEVAALQRGPIESTLKISTSLEAEASVQVLSRSGNRVVELLVEEGDTVEKDQVLVRLENEIQRTAVAKATNNYEKALREFERQKPLFEQALISEQAYSDLRFELRQMELALKDAQRELNYTEVRAPIRGTITKRLVKLGDYVTVNQQLFDMVDFNSIVAVVYHPERYLPQLSVGQAARVTSPALGTSVFPAHVKRISPVVEAKTGTVKITLGFGEVGALRPGMHVETEIVLATYSDALLIPKRALVYDGDQTYVYRLLKDKDRQVERLLVNVRIADETNLNPVEGFEEGDQIVVAGQTGLKDQAAVRLPGDPDPEETKEEDAKSKANPS